MEDEPSRPTFTETFSEMFTENFNGWFVFKGMSPYPPCHPAPFPLPTPCR